MPCVGDFTVLANEFIRNQEARATRRRTIDRLFSRVGFLLTLATLGVLAILMLNLAASGLARIDWQFLLSFPSRRAAAAGILSAWVGTVLLMIVTASVAVPLGIAAGIYLEEYAPKNRWTDFVEINIANLAGVPSILYGLMALGLFVYQFHFGQSVLAGGMALACLVLPIVIVSTREAFRTIPATIREAAFALGATRWQAVWHHLLPYSMGGIATGVILAMSRAIGESAPLITIGALTFIAFLPAAPFVAQPPFVSFDWLFSPFTALPIQMFNWVSRPGDEFQSNAAAAGLVLMVITLSMNGAAILLRRHAQRNIKW
ncbi:MAG: phosphate ABC transporter permease PstA [Verrucomicrobia bacterium]|nr:phosphate ABC transporter permease PstA [Verrucomicrobiota bacterium]